jgi:hypothetical protein
MRQGNPDYAGALSLIALGAVLGPSGLGVLTAQLLALVDPAIPLALAALGVLAGLTIRMPPGPASRSATSAILPLVVAGAAAGVVTLLALALGSHGAALRSAAVVAGICAFAASAPNGILPILLGATVLLSMTGNATVAASTTGTAAVVAIGCAVASWLLLRRPSPERQQRGVTVALLLLIGGAADYVLAPALLGGLAAGLCWRFFGGVVEELVRRDVTYLRHPALAILLLTAGAHAEITTASVAAGIGYAGVGGAFFRPRHGVPPVAMTGSNILAVAVAISALRIAGPGMALPFSAVVIGTLLSQLLGMSRGRTEPFE